MDAKSFIIVFIRGSLPVLIDKSKSYAKKKKDRYNFIICWN